MSAAAPGLPPLGHLLPGAIAALIAVYFFSQFLRSSAGVLAPDLAHELALDPLSLGVLSSAFFITFAAAQVPVGMAIDRFGAKRVLLASSAAAVVGCVLFALASDLSSLVTARALMGLGCSTFYVTALSIYARELPAAHFARIVGLQLGIGSLGALAATAPLAQLAQQFGWRAVFIGVAVALVLMLLVAALSVPPTPPTERGGRESAADSLAGVRAVLRTPGFAPLFAVHLTSYSSFAAILALWGAPFLDDVHRLDGTQRGNVLLVMALCQIGGVLAWSRLAERLRTRKVPVFTGSILAAGSTVLLALLPAGQPAAALAAACGLLGAVSAFSLIVVTQGKELFVERLVGRGLSIMNIGTMGGVVMMQMLVGAILRALGADASAYRAAFIAMAVLQLAVAAWYLKAAPETRKKP